MIGGYMTDAERTAVEMEARRQRAKQPATYTVTAAERDYRLRQEAKVIPTYMTPAERRFYNRDYRCKW